VEINKPQILTNDTLVGQLLEHKQVLCIVNTKKRARMLFDAVKSKANAYHLSTYMCPEHRSVTLSATKKDLVEGKDCIVISTQLIEAGVDIDFPVVYRDLAGIDSIAQAAGRCNREGKLDKGIVNIVKPEDPLPIGEFQRHAELGDAVCRHFKDILAPDAVMEYFVRRYRDRGTKGLDTKEIIESFNDGAASLDFPFNLIANKFNFIESVTESIVVPYDAKCRKHIEESYNGHGAPIDMTVFQRYIVNLYPNEISELRSRGYLNDNILPCPVLDVSENDFSNVYSMESGIEVNSEMETLLC
jgi:hypothetical protein